MSVYHINPKTGMPSVCKAKKGMCPYGGNSGIEGHYNTYSEAHANSQKMLESTHGLLGVEENINNRDIAKLEQEYAKVTWEPEEEMPEEELELKYEIRNTDNEDLIMGVIKGKVYVEDGWDKVGLALQNPNLPREFIDDVLSNREDYNIETCRRLMLNRSLLHDDLMDIVDNSEDMTSIALALANPALKQEYADNFLETRYDDISKLPWYYMTNNPGLKEDTFLMWGVNATINHIPIEKGYEISREYRDWMVNEYARSKRSD